MKKSSWLQRRKLVCISPFEYTHKSNIWMNKSSCWIDSINNEQIYHDLEIKYVSLRNHYQEVSDQLETKKKECESLKETLDQAKVCTIEKGCSIVSLFIGDRQGLKRRPSKDLWQVQVLGDALYHSSEWNEPGLWAVNTETKSIYQITRTI